MENRIGHVEKHIYHVESDIGEIKKDVKEIKQNTGLLTSITNYHETRLQNVESSFQEHLEKHT